MYLRIGFALFLALLFMPFLVTGADPNPGPEDLFAKALNQQDMWRKNAAPIKVRAEVTLYPEQGAAITGAYQLDWISVSQWREELRFANYVRGRIGMVGGYLQKSDTDYMPYFVFQFDSLVNLTDILTLSSKQSFGKTRLKEKDEPRQNCVEIKEEIGVAENLCFDASTGSLMSVDYLPHANHHAPFVSRIEYSDFRPYQGKLFPFEIKAVHAGQPFVTLKILDIGVPPDEKSPIYSSRPDWTFWSRCDGMEIELKWKTDLIYPVDTGVHQEGGTVYFYVIVEPDGTLSHVRLIRGATERLNQVAGVAVRDWVYTPSKCDGKPVRREMSIGMEFWPRG
jgi:Gram-negative bacterial TonB protein C-terminal